MRLPHHRLAHNAAALGAALLLVSCGAPDTSEETPAPAPLERDEAAYLDAVFEANPGHTIPGAPSDQEWIRWGDMWCEASRIQWKDSGSLEHGQNALAFERHIPERHQLQVLGLGQQAWTYLCPELDPDNVPDGEKPPGIDQ